MRTIPILGALLLATANAAAAPFAYVHDGDSGLNVVDLAANSVVANIPKGVVPLPYSMAIPPSGDRLYVVGTLDNKVAVVDTATNSVSATIPICMAIHRSAASPYGVGALNPAGTRLVVPCGSTEIDIIDTGTNTVVAQLVLPNRTYFLDAVWNPSGTRFYVSEGPGSISVFDANTLTAVQTIDAVGQSASSMVFNPSGTRLYVARWWSSPESHFQPALIVIDPVSGVAIDTIPLATNSSGMSMDPSGSRLYVPQLFFGPAANTQDVLVIDTATNATIGSLTTQYPPWVVNVSPDGKRIYVLDGSLVVFDASTLTRLATVTTPCPISPYCARSPQGVFIAPAPPNYAAGPLSGTFWNPNESGWGVSFTERGATIFVALYTYDATGNAKWYVSTCSKSNAFTCSGSVLQTTGPRFFGASFDPRAVISASVGNLSLNFDGNDSGTMSLAINGVTRTVAITRQPLASNRAPAGTDHTDLWWNPNESGWGMAMAQQDRVIFLTWYTYDNRGQPVWQVATCTLDEDGGHCTGTVYRTTGPSFGATFDPDAVHATAAGTISVAFADANNAVISYTIDGADGRKTVTRQLF